MERFYLIFFARNLIKLNPHLCKVRFNHDEKTLFPFMKPFNALDKKKIFRYTIEEKSNIASRVCVTVVGNGALGQPRCLCIFTDVLSYMFNCGEGSVRLLREHETNLSKIRHLFITQNTWTNIGGAGDLYLSQQNIGVAKIHLHGPQGIDQFNNVISSRYKKIKLQMGSIREAQYEDENLEIECVPFYYKSVNLPSRTETEEIFSYICKVKEKPGEFSIQKCIDLNLPVGPFLLDLKNGNDVILPNGKHIKSKEVFNNVETGAIFFVIDCPYEGLIENLTSNEKFLKFQSTNVIAIFHFSPLHIMKSMKYQTWMNKFSNNTLHFILNDSNSTLHSKTVHDLQHKLHLLHPEIFPLLHEKSSINIIEPFNKKIKLVPAEAMTQLYIRPKIEIDSTNVVKLSPESYKEEIKTTSNFSEHLVNLKNAIETTPTLDDQDYPEIIFLGTSSSHSTPYRNVSAILVNISEKDCILLDCGEGTYSQLLRYYGDKETINILLKLSHVFLSHHHNDHYLGIFNLIKARKEAFISSAEPYSKLILMSNYRLNNLINSFHQYFEPIKHDIRIYFNSKLTKNPLQMNTLIGDNVNLLAVPVIHCVESFGLVIWNDSWKITYSGDAAPSQTLIDAGKDSTVLIHEASIDDSLSVEAAMKMHSTPSQVVEIANQMNAKSVILTHFSKRYVTVPIFPTVDHQCVGFSFDNMAVRPRNLHLLPLFIPSLKCLFSEHLENSSVKSISVANLEKVFLKKSVKV